MLVLSRKLSEVIVINDNIRITVVKIMGDKVRIGIEAPPDVPVHRAEIHAAIMAGNPAPSPSRSGPAPHAS